MTGEEYGMKHRDYRADPKDMKEFRKHSSAFYRILMHGAAQMYTYTWEEQYDYATRN